MFGLNKTDNKEKEFINKLKNFKCRQVNYNTLNFSVFVYEFEYSPEKLLELSPVNYYASKNEYIRAEFYTNDDLSEIYVKFKNITDNSKNEKVLAKSKFLSVPKGIYIKAMAKFGIILD